MTKAPPPPIGSEWITANGRRVRVTHLSKPDAFGSVQARFEVLNPIGRQHRFSSQPIENFGTFLKPVENHRAR